MRTFPYAEEPTMIDLGTLRVGEDTTITAFHLEDEKTYELKITINEESRILNEAEIIILHDCLKNLYKRLGK